MSKEVVKEIHHYHYYPVPMVYPYSYPYAWHGVIPPGNMYADWTYRPRTYTWTNTTTGTSNGTV